MPSNCARNHRSGLHTMPCKLDSIHYVDCRPILREVVGLACTYYHVRETQFIVLIDWYCEALILCLHLGTREDILSLSG